MGSAQSQVEDLLTNGTEDEVLRYFTACRAGTLADGVPVVAPNDAVGRGDFRRTPLHIACLRHFPRVVQHLLLYGGNPALLDAHERNCIHNAVLQEDEVAVLSVLNLLIDPSNVDAAAVNRRDRYGRTPLHYAASRGLRDCVAGLLSADANPALLDSSRRTAGELARAAQHTDIATLLEGRCIFGMQLAAPPQGEEDGGDGTSARIYELLLREGSGDDDVRLVSADTGAEGVHHQGIAPQKVQEQKDQVVLQAAQVLDIPLNAAEKLLAEFNWRVLDATEGYLAARDHWQERLGIAGAAGGGASGDCIICYSDVAEEEAAVMPCRHPICQTCMDMHMRTRVEQGNVEVVECPEEGCRALIPREVCERYLPAHLIQQQMRCELRNFVQAHARIKWCPAPACTSAVMVSEGWEDTAMTVKCAEGHLFCWSCGEEAHWPCSCEQWAQWGREVAAMVASDGGGDAAQTDESRNAAWIAANTKRCPRCRKPIEKNQGCMHMTCRRQVGGCGHEFCWLCLGDWSEHNRGTGGYFGCNRTDEISRADAQQRREAEQAQEAAEEVATRARMRRFAETVRAHTEAYRLEKRALASAEERITVMCLMPELLRLGASQESMRFLQAALDELLWSRLLLRNCNIMSYFQGHPAAGEDDVTVSDAATASGAAGDGFGPPFPPVLRRGRSTEERAAERRELERQEANLMGPTELLSELAATPHVRAPKLAIVRAALEVRAARQQFIAFVKRMESVHSSGQRLAVESVPASYDAAHRKREAEEAASRRQRVAEHWQTAFSPPPPVGGISPKGASFAGSLRSALMGSLWLQDNNTPRPNPAAGQGQGWVSAAASSAAPAAAGGATSTRTVSCPTCTFAAPEGEVQCEMCGGDIVSVSMVGDAAAAAPPAFAATAGPSMARSRPQHSALSFAFRGAVAEPAAVRRCRQCTFDNPAGASTCQVCACELVEDVL